MITKDTLARFCLLNDISGEPALKAEEFFDFESTFEDKDLSGIFELSLWELADRVDKVTAEKIYSAVKIDFAEVLKNLEHFGINIIGKNDLNFPKKLTEKLKTEAPQFLYTVGDTSFLKSACAAVVGSRDLSEKCEKFAYDIGETIAKENKILISGGAKGADITATKSAIKNGGKVVWFAAVPMSQMLKRKNVFDWLKQEKLCLCSDFNPFGDFTGEKALRRNKYIYAQADTAFVCQCKSRISGTFSGANYCLKNNLSELFVYNNGSDAEKYLINNGAVEIIDR
ncbi:MAG: DNA-processing protein DprA [Acutalibacteraceae bacterium]